MSGLFRIALACTFAATASIALAFELERVDDNPCSAAANIFWAAKSAPVDVSALPSSDYQQQAEEARSAWSLASASFDFTVGRGQFCNLNDGVVSMGFRGTACTGGAFGDAVAITVTRYNRRSGEFVDADIAFNESVGAFSNLPLFREVAMHELGHALGLDHSDACGASGAGTLMNSVVFVNGPRITQPTSDDVAGANFIYGGDPPPPSDGGSTSTGCSMQASPSAGLGWLAAGALLLGARRLRRARRIRA